MDSAELVARMGSVTQDVGRVGVSSVAGFGAMDAAMMLAGLERGPCLLARVMLVLDDSSRRPLENQLWGEMCGLATDERWVVPVGEELLRCMARMAVCEAVDPAMSLCGKCHGRGVVFPRGGASRTCGACEGSGRGVRRAASRAEAVGISRSSWSRVWGPRYGIFLDRLYAWDRAMRFHLDQKIRSLM